MKVLKKNSFAVEARLELREYAPPVWHGTKGWSHHHQVPNLPYYHIYIYRGNTRTILSYYGFGRTVWQIKQRELDSGKAVYLGNRYGSSEDEVFYYYLYKGNAYESEIKLGTEEVRLIVDQERDSRKDKLRKQVDRIKARAEAEGGSRAPIKEDVQILVWNRDGGKCVTCGGTDALEFDHIIPVSKGGGNSARNIQLLCESCNRKKGAKIGG